MSSDQCPSVTSPGSLYSNDFEISQHTQKNVKPTKSPQAIDFSLSPFHETKRSPLFDRIYQKKKKCIVKTFIQFGSTFLLLGLVEWGEEAFAELFLKNCTFDQYWQENNFSLWGLQALCCLRKKKNPAAAFTIKPVTYYCFAQGTNLPWQTRRLYVFSYPIIAGWPATKF